MLRWFVALSALKLDEDRVLLEVKREENSISNAEALEAEIRLSLVGLEATECCDVWLVLHSIDDGVCSLLTKGVAEYTVDRGGCKQPSRAGDIWGWV